MKIETVQLAGSGYWAVQYDGMIDTDTIGYATEQGAFTRAQTDNPGAVIIDSDSPEHYSKR